MFGKTGLMRLTCRQTKAGLSEVSLDGKVLATAEYGFILAAWVLKTRGVSPDTLLTMRRDGTSFDAFVPIKLRDVCRGKNTPGSVSDYEKKARSMDERRAENERKGA